MFRVTQHWIKAYQSGRGGWNKKQLACIGVDWPPKTGWILAAAGGEITEQKKTEFEQLQGKSIEAGKIQSGLANMATDPVYLTEPDGKGGWTGRWLSEARWPWCQS
jgi:hypothetical protein